jgi:putative transport protein
LATLKGDGLFLIVASMVMLVLVHFILWIVLVAFRVPNIPTLLGVMSGLQTQPAALGFASTRTDPTGVNVGYASVYPLATILKIFYAQLLIILFL